MVNLPTVQSFKYLGIDMRGGASKDVDNRVAKAWSKWIELSSAVGLRLRHMANVSEK